MTMTMIQVILYLSVAIHLVHCRPIRSTSRRNCDLVLDCNDTSVEKDMGKFNDIFVDLVNTISSSNVRLH